MFCPHVVVKKYVTVHFKHEGTFQTGHRLHIVWLHGIGSLKNIPHTEADLEGACAPPKIRKACYTTLIKQFNKQLFHAWLTRDL